jgi:hypothetical protein
MNVPKDARFGTSLGVITRWGSHQKSFEKLIERRRVLQDLIDNEESSKHMTDIIDIIESKNFWDHLKFIVSVMSPLNVANVSFLFSSLSFFFILF